MMTKKHILLTWLLAVSLLLPTVLIGCTTTPPADTPLPVEPIDPVESTEPTKPIEPELTEPEPEYADRVYKLEQVADRLKHIGRISVQQRGIACDLTATGIAFNAYIKGDLKITTRCSRGTYFTVIVDGVRLEDRFFADSSRRTFTVQLEDELKQHEIRIIKETEAQLSLCILETLSFHGALIGPAADKDLYIEFVGDSITSGYGNLCENGNSDHRNAKYEGGTQSYAYLTAERLGADHSIVSCSGIGVVTGYMQFVEKEFYPLVCRYRSETEKYAFDRVPDLIVINLGTNDMNKGCTKDGFQDAVFNLILDIRDLNHADVPIVWACGMMGDGQCSKWVGEVMNDLGGEDAGLYTVVLPYNHKGGQGHPSAEGHEIAADVLLSFLEEKGLVD